MSPEAMIPWTLFIVMIPALVITCILLFTAINANYQLNKNCKETHFTRYVVIAALLSMLTLVSTPFYMMSAMLDSFLALGVLIALIPIVQDIRKA